MTLPAWRPLKDAPHATYYTSKPGPDGDPFVTIHWDAKEARIAAGDAFADLHHGDIEGGAEDVEIGILVPIARGEDGPNGPTLAHVVELDRAVQSEIARAFGALLSRLLASSQQEHLATFAPPKQVWVKKRLLGEANGSRQRGLRTFASILHTAMGGRIPDEVPK